MGYTTDFSGRFNITPHLSGVHCAYLTAFANTRRMKRRADQTETRPDPVREAVRLPIGPDGAYFTGEGGLMGQDDGPDVLNHNEPPEGQPGLWCQWVPTADGTGIEWDGNEKFYDYVEWIQYLIDNFLAPWGYTLDGTVKWRGEYMDDNGEIVIARNVVTRRNTS
jgi:hypothetical protein